MTAPLPDRIATAIETHADLWHSCGVLANGRCAIPTPAASAKRVEAEAESKVLRDLLAELVAERDAASAEVERLVKQRNEFFRAVVRVQLLREEAGALPDEAYDQMDAEIEAAESDLLRLGVAIVPDYQRTAGSGAEDPAGGGA